MEPAIADSRTPGDDVPEASSRILRFMDGDRADDFRTVSTFLMLLALHVGLRHLHLGIRDAEPAFFASSALALAAAAGCALEARRDALRWSLPLLVGTCLLYTSPSPRDRG